MLKELLQLTWPMAMANRVDREDRINQIRKKSFRSDPRQYRQTVQCSALDLMPNLVLVWTLHRVMGKLSDESTYFTFQLKTS